MKSNEIRRIAINTGGGDAPGLNAVIAAVVASALRRGWECYGIRDGFNGIMFSERYQNQKGVMRLEFEDVKDIAHLGGTILGTTNRGSPIAFPVQNPDGTEKIIDRSDEIVDYFKKHDIDALVTIGGDGSLTIGEALQKKGLKVIGVPKTIDNDLEKTSMTFGFDSAVSFAAECVDRLHSTAESHQRIMVVEVMGRYAGWIALHAGIAGRADVVLIPEIPYELEALSQHIITKANNGEEYFIVVIAEGAQPKEGGRVVLEAAEGGHEERLGGAGDLIAKQLEKCTGKEARTVVLGHLLRGGPPTSFDHLIGMRFGSAAIRALSQGESGVMVGLHGSDVITVPLSEVANKMKTVPASSDIVATARDMGICFGD